MTPESLFALLVDAAPSVHPALAGWMMARREILVGLLAQRMQGASTEIPESERLQAQLDALDESAVRGPGYTQHTHKRREALKRQITEAQRREARGLPTGPVESLAATEPADTDIVVIHDPDEGTYLESGRQHVDTIKRLRDARQIPYFRWWGGRKVWGINGSRGPVPKHNLERIAQAFRTAGLTAAVRQAEGERKSFAEHMADQTERAEAKAERLEAAAGRRAAESDAAYQRADQISERFAGGQPILVGHHSEGRARRDQARMHGLMHKSIEAEKDAAELAHRAELAERRAGWGTDTRKAATRLNTIKGELREIERSLTKYADTQPGEWSERLLAQKAWLEEERDYWHTVLPPENLEADKFWFLDVNRLLPKAKTRLGAHRLRQAAKGAGAKPWVIYDIAGGAWHGQIMVSARTIRTTPDRNDVPFPAVVISAATHTPAQAIEALVEAFASLQPKTNPAAPVALAFERDAFTPTSARAWAKANGYTWGNQHHEIREDAVLIWQGNARAWVTARQLAPGVHALS